MRNSILLSFTIILTLFSCSDSNIKISSADSFKIIEFPDGSKAYLNKHSTVEYNKNFEYRAVTQNGEVFYSVSKGQTPFVVTTQAGEVKVLGTEFNVKAFKAVLEVEVEKGIVEVKANKIVKKITKGQKVLVEDLKNGFKTSKAQFKHKTWLRDLNKTLKQISKDLKKNSKQLSKESKKIGKEFSKEIKKLK